MVTRLLKDSHGSSLIEFTLVFPVLIAIALPTVDIAYMMYDFARADKATYVGAHHAIVSNPVAQEITSLTYNPLQMGDECFDSSGNDVNCPSTETVCTATANSTTGTCEYGNKSNYTFDDSAFEEILDRMQHWFLCTNSSTCPLQRQNVTISYATDNLGFVGRPDGLPMTITVSIKCVVHKFFFIGGLLHWAFTPDSGCPSGPKSAITIPSYSTTLTSEDMVTE